MNFEVKIKMKKFHIVLLAVFLTFSFSLARAQDNFDADGPPSGRAEQGRPNLLRALGLNREQIQQMRAINVDNRERMREAQARLREAHQNLDQVIYADVIDEATVGARLRELIEAQAEIAKIRTQTEVAIRKVLTSEQLTRFRELRRNFQQRRQQTKDFPPGAAPRNRRDFPGQKMSAPRKPGRPQ